MSTVTVAPVVDLAAVKSRQQAAWSTGNYAVVGTTLQIVGETTLRSARRSLRLARARRRRRQRQRHACGGAPLVRSDVHRLRGLAARIGPRARAAEGHAIQFQEADAENLPFADASFDVVMSTFGVMFTPNQEEAASELARVCKPGGKIGLANWTPESFIGQVFKTIGKYIPPPPGVKSPALWGTKARLDELFGETARDIRATRRDFVFRYRSPAHWIEVFRTYYGPMNKTFAALDAEKQAEFTQRSDGADGEPQPLG